MFDVTNLARNFSGFLAFLILLIAALAACQPGTPRQAETPSLPALAAAGTMPPPLATLPPTWTPTHTATPAPPTATPTQTPTPTATPTLSAADRCQALNVMGTPRDGARFVRRVTAQVVFTWQYPVPDGGVQLEVRRTEDGWDGHAIVVPGTAMAAVSVPLRVLAGPGVYRWTVTPQDEAGSPLADCAQSGSFTVLLRARDARTDQSGPQPAR